ncbi:uncharacterized protein Z518_05823 [Rhinocladiella mackenziei CBS 650.93]|uniref:Uncharacterized protein n=1 Tax=Rhinocladiella mackenziei CBS 650.93 TaxID=1442369 RepID=A0A0D2FS32_9EURO|nr:uncharacterized protein Z518_05823 [Rhinocladiella mackenziei CBS 650.93]KIX04952.1 hypothetical protein Z518_05823 [Rhinocladiella mackenziei CBS 650.93]
MRLHEMPSSHTSFLAAIILTRPITAALLPELLHSFEDLQDVRKRCDNPCGYYGQLCCEADQACYTDSNNQAQCGVVATTAVASGQWEYYTTTYVQTDLKTVTETFSSYVPVSTLSCSYSLGETPCGNVCCLSGQYCQASGICVAVGGDSSGHYSSLYTVTTVVTNTASAPLRPTSNTLVTVTSIGGATTTQPFVTPVGTDGSIIYGTTSSSSGGLSGGAIAGIVIGVIAGVIILLLICACCCFKGLIDGLLAIFGLGPRRRRRTEEEVYVERRSRRSGRGGRTWFGTRPSRTSVVEEKRTGGWGRVGWVAASLGALAIWLGLKRRSRRDDKSSSGYGSSYYSDYTVSMKAPQTDGRGGAADPDPDPDDDCELRLMDLKRALVHHCMNMDRDY